jgi:putative hydrolase of the HAD superfamily|tara:strand:- start:1033 stop:1731 length:699 start_codon:yes stop_codon:yes gene_type:complete
VTKQTRAVFFDVDFTLIYPGPTFDAVGYKAFSRRHGLRVDTGRFESAVITASRELDVGEDASYRAELFVRYARRVLEEMGGTGPGIDACAREIYEEWAVCRHFSLYDDVKPALRQLHERGLRLGLISNTHRCLNAFQSHFDLDMFIAGAVSSSDHGFMKPHPSIFEAALLEVGVSADEALMVGDSISHDVDGALRLGMQAVLLARSGQTDAPVEDVPVIASLSELPAVIDGR